MVEIKLLLHNRATRSLITGVMRFQGGCFHDIVDDLPRRIENRMRGFMKKNHPAECIYDWSCIEVVGYQQFELWAGRIERARGKFPKKTTRIINKKQEVKV